MGAIAAAGGGCWSSQKAQVVVYTALDREFSAPIFAQFTASTGIRVLPKFDTESTKTVGLTHAIMAEAGRPRCDVFWNNEILNTLRLQERGLLDAYIPAAAGRFPAAFQDPEGHWHGFAARARVLLVNHKLLPTDEAPQSITELADPRWKDRAGLAKPLFGTTATHAAVLFALWGKERAEDFFRQVRQNALVLGGNKQVALAVSRGEIAWGLTDSDDAIIEIERGFPVRIVYPDQQQGQMGTLFIPNTLALVRGAPHPRAAARLIDYLLSAEVEARLAEGRSAQIPLGVDVRAAARVATPQSIRGVQVDFRECVDQWDHAAEFLREEFVRVRQN
jgi:iron(III) transport system substrate-binding protein